ncbi:MAG: hypothetical protein IJ548_02690 [Paludibacteraceae bacterium]|nr:hypothetical protein [Paludibacteraceae bacterium]MBQ8705194.1 hypothetical protein [Paludibacteraceae bacterium]
MEEVIKYFEGLEERIATLEAELASLEAEIDELKSRPAPEPQVVEKVVEKIVEKPVEVIKEVVVEKPVVVAAPVVPEKPEEPEAIQEEPAAEEPVKAEPVKEDPAPAKEEVVSPKAAVYGKAVDDIRQAISLGDRFLYQRELFNQNAELMQKTLTELNELGSFDEAIQYISRFGWDTESNSYQQFIVALHRRFG